MLNMITNKKMAIAYAVIAILSFSGISHSAAVNSPSDNTYFNSKELTSSYTSWGIAPTNPASINLLEAWKKFEKKKDIIVAVVDTGIDNTHPFLSKNVFVKEGNVSESNFGVDFSKNKKNLNTPIDTNGHGSHIAGIIKSIHPEVKILALKYYNPEASGDDNLNSTVEALEYAVEQNVDIINYSAGGPGASSRELRVLKEAEKKGILVIVAAGNKGSNIDNKSNGYFPASYGLKNIITVTAHDENLNILDSSNFGQASVDISAPGYRIKSALYNGNIGFLTGTSQATAFVTGVAALIKAEFPSLTFDKVKEIIKSSAKKEVAMASKCSSGGRLDAGSALALAERMTGSTSSQRQIANNLIGQ